MKSILHMFLCGLLYVAPAHAQTSQDVAGTVTLSDQTMGQIINNPDQFIERSIAQLFNLAPDGVLSAAILETHQKMQMARMRSNQLEQLLQYDLDANLIVDAAEIETVMRVLDSRRKAVLQTTLVISDVDQDGALSMQEIVDYAAKKTGPPRPQNTSSQGLMEFDVNRDGKVTPQEISTVVATIVKRD